MNSRNELLKFILIVSLLGNLRAADDLSDLDLLEDSDINLLLNDGKIGQDLDLSRLEEVDDLEALKSDIGTDLPDVELSQDNKEKLKNANKMTTVDPFQGDVLEAEMEEEKQLSQVDKPVAPKLLKKPEIFDVGKEEKKLLELAKYVEKKIPSEEWSEIAASAKVEKYVVNEGDWLWKISQRLFGSGFYYSKIWSMNPQITNPHEIEPGQVLVFDTGSAEDFPQIQFGDYDLNVTNKNEIASKTNTSKMLASNLSRYGDDILPPWLKERQQLKNDGAFFQYLTDTNYEDVFNLKAEELNEDYKKYDPPVSDVTIDEPSDSYDENGFLKMTKMFYNISSGFYLNTFLTTNFVQDLGVIEHKRDESFYIKNGEIVYAKFDESVKPRPGDLFSVYYPEGKTSHVVSDREGLRYTIVAQVKALRKLEDKWEVQVVELSGLVERNARLTVYTPKIDKIFKSYNKRNIEAAIIGSYKETTSGIALGDVVYLDRGRVDGVELGNVFETYAFRDQGTGKKISNIPTYQTGEMTVITLSDNFATALVTKSSTDFNVGVVALTKTEEKALRQSQLKQNQGLKDTQEREKLGLEELDVELNLDDLSQDLLNKIDDIQVSEDDLEELERQEREKSIIKDHEKDLKELERLEKDLIDAESKLNEKKIDEDAYLEKQDLDKIENGAKPKDPNAFESMNEIEANLGKKYMDEDINSKENPYGLTEFDLEEIDELLNTESN